ncbi:hypothetical protein ACOMHN_064449 [Nucella lapillus]
MLLHSGGHVQPSCYYPDPTYFPQHATPPPPHFDIDAFLSHPSAAAYQGHTTHAATTTPCPTLQQQNYYHHHQDYSGGFSQLQNPYGFSCSCGCAWKPVQETFLHKILTGKGYQNDSACRSHHHHHHHHNHLFASGPSMEPQVFAGQGSEFVAMAGASSSCCYAGRTAMAMPGASASFPQAIPGL